MADAVWHTLHDVGRALGEITSEHPWLLLLFFQSMYKMCIYYYQVQIEMFYETGFLDEFTQNKMILMNKCIIPSWVT